MEEGGKRAADHREQSGESVSLGLFARSPQNTGKRRPGRGNRFQ